MSKDEEQQHENVSSDDFTDRELQNAHGSKRTRDGLFLPFFLSLVASTWFTWGGIELAADANTFSLHPNREMTPEELAAREARAKARMAGYLYATYCGTCHQPSGQGIPGTYPPLDASEWLDDGQRVVSLTLAGMKGRIEVNGQIYDNPNGMPAIAKTANLKAEQIVTIVNYVRNSWSNGDKEYPDITVDDVDSAKKRLGDRTTPWTPEELLKEHPLGRDGG